MTGLILSFEEIPVSSGVLCASFCAIPIFRFVV